MFRQTLHALHLQTSKTPTERALEEIDALALDDAALLKVTFAFV